MGTAGHEVGSGRRVESATAADHLGCAGVCSPSSHEATPRMAKASTFPGSNECSLSWCLQGNMAPQALTQHARGATGASRGGATQRMAAVRLSQLQKHILRWLAADHQRTHGVIASSHPELVHTLQRDKGNLSHSLRTLERHGFLIIGRSSGRHAESLRLTPEGQKRASQLAGSCD